jgi:uncharacterized membrane protein YhaH (DUF805 family)
MSTLSLLFSFKGRITRSQYWLGAFLQIVTPVLLCVVLFVTLGGANPPDSLKDIDPKSPQAKELLPLVLGFLAALIMMLWSGAAIYTKRLHDRNKGAIWLLAIYVPSFISFVFPPAIILVFISGLWAFIELGCLPGTPGPNRFDDADSSAYLDDAFGKAPAKSGKMATSEPQGYGGMEAAMAAVTAAARDVKPPASTSFANQRAGFGQATPAQFGRLGPSSGGFGRKGLS